MADLRSLPRDFLRDFIEIYKENTCLWKVKSKDYSNRQKKTAAYEILRRKLSEVEANATKENVVKKINSLRTCFRKEYRKVVSSERSGAGFDDVYTPTLWYYELLLFLTDQDEPRASITNVPDDTEVENIEEAANSQREFEETENSPIISDFEENTRSSIISEVSQSGSKETFVSPSTAATSSKNITPRGRAIKRVKKSDEVLDLVAKRLKEPKPASSAKKFDSFGSHVAEQLRGVSEEQARYLTKIINAAVFEAQCGSLSKDSYIVTPSVSHSVQLNPQQSGSLTPIHYTLPLDPQSQQSGSLTQIHYTIPLDPQSQQSGYNSSVRHTNSGSLADYFSRAD